MGLFSSGISRTDSQKLQKVFTKLVDSIKSRFEDGESEIEVLKKRVDKLEATVKHLTSYVDNEPTA